jgi:hydrogenase maturation factor
MTAYEFRRIALGLTEAVEGAHMGHPDFRVRNRIFASLNAEQTIGNIKLTPDEQQRFVATDATVFVPVAGAWGLHGWTAVHLVTANLDVVGEALTSAWQLMQAQGPSKKSARATASAFVRPAKKAGAAGAATRTKSSAASTGTRVVGRTAGAKK